MKKLIVLLLTDKTARKAIIGSIVALVFVLIFPFYMFGSLSDISISAESDVTSQVLENFTSSEMEEIDRIDRELSLIIEESARQGLSQRDTDRAQAVYLCFLPEQKNVAETLVEIFRAAKTTEELAYKINAEYGTEYMAADFTDLFQLIEEERV